MGILTVDGISYNIFQRLGSGRFAEVFLIGPDNLPTMAAKIYAPDTKAVSRTRGFSNHYGGRRDVSELVFNEIKELNQYIDILPKFFHREYVNGSWILLMEYIPGVPFDEFVVNADRHYVDIASFKLGALLKRWHEHSLAHGDPRLPNALVDIQDGICNIRLVDLGMLHFPSFHYCQELGCFSKFDRYRHDLWNPTKYTGPGFLFEIDQMVNQHKLPPSAIEAFTEGYF